MSLQRIALALTRLAERWLPDAFVFALAATVVVFVAGLGNGFPDLLAFAMQMALVFSLVFSAVLARAIARRFAASDRRVDYRALGAASLLGLGSVWAQGLSGSAALQMATPSALPQKIRLIIANGGAIPDGVVSFAHTVFLWQSLVSVAIELVVVTLLMWLVAPSEASARDACSSACSCTGRPRA